MVNATKEGYLPDQSPLALAPEKLTRRMVMAYASGNSGLEAASYILLVLLFFHYTSVLGLSGQLTGFALMCALIVDAVTDPLIAVITDRWRSRWGRRHPFMLASTIPAGLLLYLVFNPPELFSTSSGMFIWLMVLLIALRVTLTAFTIPYFALGAELSNSYTERTRVVAARNLGAVVGAGSVMALYYNLLFFYPSPAEYADPRLNPAPISLTSVVASLLLFSAALLATYGTREAIKWQREPAPEDSQSLLVAAYADMVGVLEIRNFWILFIAFASFSLATSITAAMTIHFALYFWEVSLTVQGIAGMLQVVGIVFGISYFRRLADRVDKKYAFQISIFWFSVFTVGAPLFYMAGLFPENGTNAYFVAYFAVTVLIMFGGSGKMLSDAMIPDVADEDELSSGKRRIGFIFAARSFSGKFGDGVAALLAGIIFDMSGLTAGVAPADAPAAAGTTLGLWTAGITGLLLAAGSFVLGYYDLSRERHVAIQEQLEARNQAD